MNERHAWRFLLVVIGVVALAACTPSEDSAVATPTSAAAHGVRLVRQADGSWHADATEGIPLIQVVRIVDGDTLVVALADGRTERVRLFGVDAPEVTEPCGPEATADLERLAGASVRLLEDTRTQDAIGRALRYVFTSDGVSVDAELIRRGSAKAWEQDGAFRDTLARLEATARLEGTGCLWRR